MQTEKEITAAIRSVLKNLGIMHWKQFQTLGSPKGIADIIGCYKGRFIAIEVKTEKGKLSDAQELFLKKVNAAGGLGFVAKSIDDLIRELNLQNRFLI